MDNTADTAQVIIRPPLAWGLAVIAGLALNWLVPLPFLPTDLPAGWRRWCLFSRWHWSPGPSLLSPGPVRTSPPICQPLPSSRVDRFTRNPIYLGMFLGLIGLAITFDDLWLLMMLVPFALVIRYGAVARRGSLSQAQVR
jgi:hypothetical protein